ncbi:MAG: MgtC/SapB family protein [Candidatus Eremiobacteraeota bacterium]|nr:MgtC/SapB family protein [Candidatus Eremiobacteraeota bacterium]
MVAHWPVFFDLLLAAVFGGAVGIQRQAAQKPAGFRTHLLVSLGACAFAEVSRLTGDDRIASNIVTGIGFLGAGAIVRSGISAHGLTTAASIWAVAAVGAAMGIGHTAALPIALGTTAITLLTLATSDALLERTMRFHRKANVVVRVRGNDPSVPAVRALVERPGTRLENEDRFAVRVDPTEPSVEVSFFVDASPQVELATLVRDLAQLPGVLHVSLEEPSVST